HVRLRLVEVVEDLFRLEGIADCGDRFPCQGKCQPLRRRRIDVAGYRQALPLLKAPHGRAGLYAFDTVDGEVQSEDLVQGHLNPADLLARGSSSCRDGRRRASRRRGAGGEQRAFGSGTNDAVDRQPLLLLKAAYGAARLRPHDAVYGQVQRENLVERSLDPGDVLGGSAVLGTRDFAET